MSRARKVLIIGGTRGLGLQLANEAARRHIEPIITGKSIGKKGIRFIHKGFRLDLVKPRLATQEYLEVMPNKARDIFYFFWVAGLFLEKSFLKTSRKERAEMWQINVEGPQQVLQEYMRVRQRPFHLVVICPRSSRCLSRDQSTYHSCKSAQASLCRNLCLEFQYDELFASTQATLVNVSDMQTDLYEGTSIDTTNFLNPVVVAKVIWDEILRQTNSFEEIQIVRKWGGELTVEYGSRAPQLYE